MKEGKPKKENLLPRPPIIVVMGHIDHGKTTLLDYIRKANVAGREAGGITQSIGAYEIGHSATHSANDQGAPSARKITFIDTPGHEAFSKMRARGAKVADLAILVVAADDGVKPQTKEAIEHIKKADLTFIVAINKIDKNNADPERVKSELTNAGVLLEGSGGNVSWQTISAKTGEGVNELLDLILLAAELENLTYNPAAGAKGVIIEAKIDSRQGLMASAILKDGALKAGQIISTPTAGGKIKFLKNFLGQPADLLEPSAPVLIFGFETLPQIGEEFTASETSGALEKAPAAMPALTKKKEIITQTTKAESDRPKVILKASDAGSLEALKDLIGALPIEPKVKIIETGIGNIKENDAKLAAATGAIILGFKVKTDKAGENLAKAHSVKIIASEIIYELLKTAERHFTEIAAVAARGELEVLAIFGRPKGKQQVIGGKIISGVIKNKSDFEVIRSKKSLGFGRLRNLQQNKINASEAKEGEAGMMVEASIIIKEGDVLKF